MSGELGPGDKPKVSRESLFVLLLGCTLFAAGAVLLSFAIVESIAGSAEVIARPPSR